MAPGRPPLAHQGAGPVVQPHGGSGSFEIDPVQLGLARGGGKPLPQAVLAKMEAAFGADFSAVRVHVGPQASRIGAVAFTMGNDLYFAPGQFQPDSARGQQLIGHELAHVVQQRQGRVRAPTSGVAVVQDRALEAEADRLGMRAAVHAGPLQRKAATPPGSGAPLAGRSTRSGPPMPAYAAHRSCSVQRAEANSMGSGPTHVKFTIKGQTFSCQIVSYKDSDVDFVVKTNSVEKARLRQLGVQAGLGPVRIAKALTSSLTTYFVTGSNNNNFSDMLPDVPNKDAHDLSLGYKYKVYHFSDEHTPKSTEYIVRDGGPLKITSHGHGTGIYGLDPGVYEGLDKSVQIDAAGKGSKWTIGMNNPLIIDSAEYAEIYSAASMELATLFEGAVKVNDIGAFLDSNAQGIQIIASDLAKVCSAIPDGRAFTVDEVRTAVRGAIEKSCLKHKSDKQLIRQPINRLLKALGFDGLLVRTAAGGNFQKGSVVFKLPNVAMGRFGRSGVERPHNQREIK